MLLVVVEGVERHHVGRYTSYHAVLVVVVVGERDLPLFHVVLIVLAFHVVQVLVVGVRDDHVFPA